jgi:hypothetical protein
MKKIIRLFSFVVLLISLVSCSGEESDLVSIIEIKVDDHEDEKMFLSSICSELNYLPLTTDQIVGSIDHVTFNENEIVIFDTSSPAIHRFDYNGQHINSITILEGNGPNELQFISDYTINQDEEVIEVLGYQKIVSYAMSGQPIDASVLSVLPQQMIELEGDTIFYFGNSVYSSSEVKNYEHKLLIISEDGEIQNALIPIKEINSNIRYQVDNSFPVYNGKQLFFTNPEPFIYEITDNNLLKRYSINFGEAAIPEGYFAEISSLDNVNILMDQVFSDGYVSLLHNVIETQNAVYFQFHTSFTERSSVAFYSKASEETTTGKGFENDIDGGIAPTSFTANYDDEWLVGTVYPSDILNVEDQIRNVPNSNLNEVIANTTSSFESNPVLMRCKTK